MGPQARSVSCGAFGFGGRGGPGGCGQKRGPADGCSRAPSGSCLEDRAGVGRRAAPGGADRGEPGSQGTEGQPRRRLERRLNPEATAGFPWWVPRPQVTAPPLCSSPLPSAH